MALCDTVALQTFKLLKTKWHLTLSCSAPWHFAPQVHADSFAPKAHLPDRMAGWHPSACLPAVSWAGSFLQLEPLIRQQLDFIYYCNTRFLFLKTKILIETKKRIQNHANKSPIIEYTVDCPFIGTSEYRMTSFVVK